MSRQSGLSDKMYNFFLDHFPPPDYLRMPAVGLDISDRSIKYVELYRDAGEIYVKRFGNEVVPEGIIEEGEVKDIDKFKVFLGSFKEKAKIDYVMVGLPEEKSFLSKVELPKMEDSEIRNVLELQLEEHVPLSAEEGIFDFDIMPGCKKENHLDINLTVFPRGIVEDYRDAFIGAGINPLVFETESQAYIRAMVSKQESLENKANMIIDFGKTRTTYAIASGGKLQFTSSLKMGGKKLEESIVKNMAVDEGQAKKIKIENGFIKSKNNEKSYNAMLPVISSLKDEAQKYISYWNSRVEKGNHETISKVLLCGGDSNLFGIVDYLSYELKLPVEIGSPWVNILSFEDRIPEMDLRESLFYTTAIGLALRSINKK